jgi:acyl carrier protein
MSRGESAKDALRAWVRENSRLGADVAIDDTTPILERRIITSLQLTDLILFLESVRGSSVDVTKLSGSNLKSIDAIAKAFLE